jgi:hypothetical protein
MLPTMYHTMYTYVPYNVHKCTLQCTLQCTLLCILQRTLHLYTNVPRCLLKDHGISVWNRKIPASKSTNLNTRKEILYCTHYKMWCWWTNIILNTVVYWWRHTERKRNTTFPIKLQTESCQYARRRDVINLLSQIDTVIQNANSCTSVLTLAFC